jgi:hypothetical protein
MFTISKHALLKKNLKPCAFINEDLVAEGRASDKSKISLQDENKDRDSTNLLIQNINHLIGPHPDISIAG